MRLQLKFTAIVVALVLAGTAAPPSVRAQSAVLQSQEGALFLGSFLLWAALMTRPSSSPVWGGKQSREGQATETPRGIRALEARTFNPQIKKSLATKGYERLRLTGRWLKSGKAGNETENSVAAKTLARGDSDRQFILWGPPPGPNGLRRSHHLALGRNLDSYSGL